MNVFVYIITDAWGNPVSKVRVTEHGSSAKIICKRIDRELLASGKLKETKVTFNRKIGITDINRIKNILLDNLEIFEYSMLEFNACMDGCINRFYFQLYEDVSNEIMGFNIGEFKKPDYYCFDGEPVKANHVIKVFESISEILIQNGVDEKYLTLGG